MIPKEHYLKGVTDHGYKKDAVKLTPSTETPKTEKVAEEKVSADVIEELKAAMKQARVPYIKSYSKTHFENSRKKAFATIERITGRKTIPAAWTWMQSHEEK